MADRWRAVQGLGAGGLQALAQVVIAALIPPRERGRYSGYLGAVLAAATVSGPLVGGLLVDTDGLGWRWCFYVGVPSGCSRWSCCSARCTSRRCAARSRSTTSAPR